jgi:hypothetical protein
MLDRISQDAPLIEFRSPRRANPKFPRSLRADEQAQQKLDDLTAQFRNALKKSVEGIIEAGRVVLWRFTHALRCRPFGLALLAALTFRRRGGIAA